MSRRCHEREDRIRILHRKYEQSNVVLSLYPVVFVIPLLPPSRCKIYSRHGAGSRLRLVLRLSEDDVPYAKCLDVGVVARPPGVGVDAVGCQVAGGDSAVSVLPEVDGGAAARAAGYRFRCRDRNAGWDVLGAAPVGDDVAFAAGLGEAAEGPAPVGMVRDLAVGSAERVSCLAGWDLILKA